MKINMNQLSVGKKLFAISLFFITALIGIVLYTVITLNQQKADAGVINIAGRQRMLTQKFTKEVLDELGGQGTTGSQLSKKTATLFDKSLTALRSGGITYADLDMSKPLTLPGNSDPAIEAKLKQVATLWQQLLDATNRIRETTAGTAEYQQQLKRIRTLNIDTLKQMNTAVGMMAAASTNKIGTMMMTEGFILLLVLAAGLGFSLVMARSITIPMQNIVSVTRSVAAGDLNIDMNTLHTESRDEVGEVARSFEQMIGVLRRMQRELDRVTLAAGEGKLDERCDNSGFTGAWGNLLGGINDIIELFNAPLNEASRYLDRISHGDIPAPIDKEYKGDFNRIKDSVNRCVQAVNGLLGESSRLIQAARDGELNYRSEATGFEGSWKELLLGLNGIFDAIAEPVEGTKKILQLLAEGDLTKTLEGNFNGEFAALQESVNTTIRRLRQTLQPVQDAVEMINTAADEISAGNNNLSARTENQASSLEQTAASMEELTSTVKNNADNAQQGNQLAIQARQLAEKGGEVIGHAVVAMAEIDDASRRIAEIIGVIDEIAFQTNLLALNASVEAARAGEQGRGFAVVATEVRNLAGRSATAAKEIKTLINDSVGKVNTGTSLVNQSGQTLEEIVTAVKKVGDIVSEITFASQEQSTGIDQVNQAVTSMDQMTQQNAALAEQTSAAAASMTERVQQLQTLVQVFRIPGETLEPPRLQEHG